MALRKLINISCAAALVISSGLVIGCQGESAQNTAVPSGETETTAETTTPRVTPTAHSQEQSPFEGVPPQEEIKNPTVVFNTSHGAITVELYQDKAPMTVSNFLENYTKRDFYTDTIFHYVEPGMVVGGGYDAQHQFKETRAEIRSEATNGISNKAGTVAMARSPDFAHSATSQFFFNVKDNPQFDHQDADTPQNYGYCVFGKVIGGMDVLGKIAAVATKESEISPRLPSEPVVIYGIDVIE